MREESMLSFLSPGNFYFLPQLSVNAIKLPESIVLYIASSIYSTAQEIFGDKFKLNNMLAVYLIVS